MLLDRAKFAHHFDEIKDGLGDEDSPLWIPEEDIGPCQWFLRVKLLRAHHFKKEYWAWCDENLIGDVRCFSSDSEHEQEWWGFTDKQDMVLWTLKWM